MDQSYLKLIHSERVTGKTRDVLLDRARPLLLRSGSQGVSFENFAVLQAVLDRLIPQKKNEDFIDIAAILGSRNAEASGDGWRYANMPPDSVALGLGLQCLEASAQLKYGAAFPWLDAAQQDALLAQVQKGELAWSGLDARRWFEDVLAQATEIYVSHPATLASMGFSGIAFLPRWVDTGLNSTQWWEPNER